MSRAKIKFPSEQAYFSTKIPVRIENINYSGHVGNDSYLSIIHEARMQLLRKHGYDELNAGGVGLVVADAVLAYKGEAFYGDDLDVDIYVENILPRSFDLLYRIATTREGIKREIVHAKTCMACYDFQQRKLVSMTDDLKKIFI